MSKNETAHLSWRSRLWLGLLALLLPLLMQMPSVAAQTHGAAPTVASAQDYRLGPQDRVRLRAFEWRPNVDTVFEWTSLNAEFTVGAAGKLSLPMLGEVDAAGLTPSELAKAIGERLKTIIGLTTAPNIAVEVTQYRPFYIMGGINRPGEYPYRPGLTVLQAVSVAGGILGSGESGMRAGREIISGRGELQQTTTEIAMLMARKARLEAEAAGAEKIQFPADLEKRKADASVQLMLQQEQSIFDTRRRTMRTEIDVFEQLKEFLAKEIESIDGQVKAQANERDILKKELDNISGLVARGLAAAPRQLELERSVSRMEGERLRLQSTLLTARQNISRTDVSIVEARNRRANEVAADLRDTQNRLDVALTRYGTAERLIYETQFATPQAGAGGGAGRYAPTYTIVRHNKEIQATDATTVEPGDTLRVVLPVPEGLGTNPIGRSATQ